MSKPKKITSLFGLATTRALVELALTIELVFTAIGAFVPFSPAMPSKP